MQAEIIDFRAWRREHRAPETTTISFPVLLPTWPWGWLQPMLLEVNVGVGSRSLMPPSRSAQRPHPGTLPPQTSGKTWPPVDITA